KPPDRPRLDLPPAADRHSGRLWNGARAVALAGGAFHADRAAILDLFPHPYLRLDQHSSARRSSQSNPAWIARGRRAAGLARDRYGGLYRHGLFVSAVHGASALRNPAEYVSDVHRG